jgi:hypothetical protein
MIPPLFGKQEVGIWWIQKRYGVPIWSLWPNIRSLSSIVAEKNVMRRIFLSNYWWQESDIWSQTSYMYAILWEAFLDPSDSYFLFADLVGFYTHWTIWHTYMKFVTKYQIPVINSCLEKCDEKWAYMFNVYKNQQSRQTGSRNSPKREGVILFYLCPSILPSVRPRYFSSHFSQ